MFFQEKSDSQTPKTSISTLSPLSIISFIVTRIYKISWSVAGTYWGAEIKAIWSPASSSYSNEECAYDASLLDPRSFWHRWQNLSQLRLVAAQGPTVSGKLSPSEAQPPPVGLLLPISRAHGDHTLGHPLVGRTLQAPAGSPPFTQLPSSCTRSDLRL